MVISHYGLGMVKIQQGETVVIFNPIGEVGKSAPAGVKAVKLGADIALIGAKDPAYNGAANAARGDRQPFVVDGPGEYEVGGVFIKGFLTSGPEGRLNTVYLLMLEQLRVVHLGALAPTLQSGRVDPLLDDHILEGLGAVDLLFVPVGNGRLLNPKQAAQVVAALGPELVVPVDYDDQTLPVFLKEMGAEKEKPVESLALKKKDFIGGQTRVAVIKSY